MDKNIASAIKDRLIEEPADNLETLTENVKSLKNQLKIPNTLAKNILSQLDQSYYQASEGIKMTGGSIDDIAKLWGYNYANYLYDYLADRDTLKGRQALSFIRMQLGHELNNRIGSDFQYSSFILGLSLRFMKGFEKLKDNLAEINEALKKFEENSYVHKTVEEEAEKIDLFGRKREKPD